MPSGVCRGALSFAAFLHYTLTANPGPPDRGIRLGTTAKTAIRRQTAERRQ